MLPFAAMALAASVGAAAASPRPARAPQSPACDGCHGGLGAGGPAPHQAFFAESCTSCHSPTPRGRCAGPSKGWALIADGARLCEDCHGEARQAPAGQSLHTPVRQGKCFSCHVSHGKGKVRLLVAEPPELCLRCHEARAPGPVRAASRLDMQAPTIHGALTNGCRSCHAAGHRGANPKLLLQKSANALCGECHERKDQLPEVHRALETQGCLGCHVPHTSRSPRLLVAPTAAALCLNCHPAMDERPSAHPPVAKRQCTSCHEPHASRDAPLLKADGKKLCRSCHPKIGAASRRHRPLVRRGCETCHVAHGEGPKLLRRPVNEGCERCHAKQRDGLHVKAGPKIHPVSGAADRLHPGRELSCVSCHDPHGGANARFLSAADPAKSCAGCHKT